MRSDTSWGGNANRFPDTSWGMVVRMRATASVEMRSGLEELCRRYWKPVYTYLRMVWRQTNEDAKDLSQAFFAWILDSEAIRRYLPERGSFRTYLRTLLQRFVKDRTEAMHALKRGGGVRILPLEAVEAAGAAPADASELSPEEQFDRDWALATARHAIDRVRERLRQSGRSLAYDVYAAYDLRSGGAPPTYATVARELGIKESDVRNHLHTVREEIRAEIRLELSRTSTSEQEAAAEYRRLFER